MVSEIKMQRGSIATTKFKDQYIDFLSSSLSNLLLGPISTLLQ
jgi:hypothetical protein